MAAPLVSGSAAVLWSVAPELSAEEVKRDTDLHSRNRKINLSGGQAGRVSDAESESCPGKGGKKMMQHM